MYHFSSRAPSSVIVEKKCIFQPFKNQSETYQFDIHCKEKVELHTFQRCCVNKNTLKVVKYLISVSHDL